MKPECLASRNRDFVEAGLDLYRWRHHDQHFCRIRGFHKQVSAYEGGKALFEVLALNYMTVTSLSYLRS